MIFQGIWPSGDFTAVDSLVVSLIAIVLVFLVLIIVILVTHGITIAQDKADSVVKIKPRPENKILEDDKDAVAAVLAATIDFHKETGKDAEVKSIERIDE
ncbi:MAG: OadG family protein [Bacilli bacterium]|nr:OadG family protein [Bacilli bacterium]